MKAKSAGVMFVLVALAAGAALAGSCAGDGAALAGSCAGDGAALAGSCAGDGAGTRSLLDAYVVRFNATDEELYTNAIPNSAAAAFLSDAVPLFACPDKDIERTYYFRWWTYRKHLRRQKSGDGWVVTEFLPDVGWAGAENTISCPFGHHVREGRWLRDAKYVESYLAFMLAKGRINGVSSYCCWPATSALDSEEVTGHCALTDSLLDQCVANFERWREGWNVWGLSLQSVKGCNDYSGVTIKAGWRAERGLYDFVGNYEGSEFALSAEGARPLVNAAMWSEAASIARIARRSGRIELADRFAKMADELAANVRARLWNAKKGFFTALACDGRLDDVCELNGYAPFYFGMPLPAAYGAAWDRLLDEKGFRAPKGLTFPARDTPGFAVTSRLDCHECLWNGPSWPYATSVALTGLSRWLQGGGATKVTRGDFTALLAQYAAQQRLARPPEAGGETVPWIDENLDPFTGEWLARKVLQGKARTGKQTGPRERGKDYNHSTFCDLVISGLVGFVPGDGESFAIDPCAPESWDFFTLERVRYRGHDVAVRWHRGQGGLTVEVDGKLVAQSDRLRRLDVKLAPELGQWASSQLSPTPMPTSSGTPKS